MPFTFSHPAIILPFKYFPRKWFSMTALIIGSLTPDFEYFIRMKVQSIYSHTLFGILWFDLPLTLLLAFIFHNIIRNDLVYNLPNTIQSRFYPFTNFNWNRYFKENWLIVIISALIGILSHLFWDAFTHEHGYFVYQISELKSTLNVAKYKIPVWKILQHLSTLLGGIIIITAISNIPQKTLYKFSSNRKYWISVFLITVLIAVLRFSFSFNIKAFGNIIVSLIAAFLLSLTLIPFLIKSKVTKIK